MSEAHIQFARPPILESCLHVTLDAAPLQEVAMRDLAAKIDTSFEQFADIRDEGKNWCGARFCRNGNRFLSLQNAKQAQSVIFSYNVTPPYVSWDEFVAPAVEALKTVAATLKATKFSDVGVRTIDKLVVPVERSVSVGTILRNGLSDIDGMPPAGVYEFYLRDTSYYRDFDIWVRTIRATQANGKGRPPDIILDTDVYVQKDLDVGVDADLKDALNRIREVRYKVFVGSIDADYLERCK